MEPPGAEMRGAVQGVSVRTTSGFTDEFAVQIFVGLRGVGQDDLR